ncbi:hypothetical protein B0E48_04680 [Rhodanobacter sp. C03]|nr:hypothetical protein B0E48_04680 [Rhodanobacter sp. C03]
MRELRAQMGITEQREIWQALGTSDRHEALRRVSETKAKVLRAFDDETAQLTAALNPPPRIPPTEFQLQQAAFAFKAKEQGELYRERLHYLPTGKQVREAADQRFILDSTPLSPSETAWDRFSQRLELESIIDSKQRLTERRHALRAELAAHLGDHEFVLVDWAIQQIADQHGYLIEQDDANYRVLGSLLMRAWIQELDSADSVFMNVDLPASTANLFQAGQLGGQPSANDGAALVTSDAAESERDILVLFEDYLSDQKKSLSSSGEADIRRTMQQFVEVSGISDVTAYRKAHATAYKKRIQQLPPNAVRDYPGKTVDQIIKSVPAGAPRLKPKTINARLSQLAVFGKWLEDTRDDVVAINFTTAALPVAGTSDKMKEFTDEEVSKIFLHPTFIGCAGERNQSEPGDYRVRDFRFWLPLTAAYSGCRLNELTQLQISDIFERDGVLTLNVTDSGDGQSLKNQQSKRLVPVHSVLLELGFKERLDAVKAAGKEHFFHDIPVDRGGRRSEAAGKRFRKYLTRIGVKRKGVGQRGGIHRFRHTVIEKLRSYGLFDHQIAPFVGHQASLAPMTSGYGSSSEMTLAQRKEAIELIRYDGLDLGLLK